MTHRLTSVCPNQLDEKLANRVFLAQRVCLALVALIALITLFARYVAPIGRLLPACFGEMQTSFALATFFCCAGLFLSDRNHSINSRTLGLSFTLFAGVGALALPFEPVRSASTTPGSVFFEPASYSASIVSCIALSFIFLVVFLTRSISYTASRVADIATVLLCLLVLILGSESFYALLRVPGSSADGLPSSLTLVSLLLLTAAIFFHRAQIGVFSIVLGSGIGGRLARILAPVLLLLPIVREACRARILKAHLVPGPYAIASLSSLATVIGFFVLIRLASRLNTMETEIHDLTLRDDLTDLYNIKGFHLLAEQSLRMAQRAQLPFSVLFIDVDGLKQINDRLGHQTGSALIAETGKLLQAGFREVDVIARIGGDEFVVAGQLSHEAAAEAAQRLQVAAEELSCDASRRFPLSLSIGHATSSVFRSESLKELVGHADQAMYETKRRKKIQISPMAAAG